MVAVRDFSGFAISAWALASAAASAPILSLECCMTGLHSEQFKTDRPRLRSFGPHPVPCGLPGILRYQGLQLRLGPVMVERGRPRQPIEVGKLGPGVGAAHVDGPDRFDPRPRRLYAEE